MSITYRDATVIYRSSLVTYRGERVVIEGSGEAPQLSGERHTPSLTVTPDAPSQSADGPAPELTEAR